MKKLFLIIIALFISAAFIYADYYLKEVEHTDAFTVGGVTTPAVDHKNEYWIKDKKMVIATLDWGKTFIFDLTKKRFVFINVKAKTYVEMSVPLDPAKIFSDQLALKYEMYKETCSLAKTGKTKKILGKTCTGYETKSWKVSAGTKYGEIEAMVWASTDVPFDLDVYYGMVRCIRVLLNRDEVFRKNFEKVKGCLLGVDMTMVRQGRGTKIKATHRIVEIVEKKAPPHIFSIPRDYVKKEKLTYSDLWE